MNHDKQLMLYMAGLSALLIGFKGFDGVVVAGIAWSVYGAYYITREVLRHKTGYYQSAHRMKRPPQSDAQEPKP